MRRAKYARRGFSAADAHGYSRHAYDRRRQPFSRHDGGKVLQSITAFHDFAKIQEGSLCPKCGKPAITVSRGIEVGNIFQLGMKYTQAMGMQYLDAGGAARSPLMGCYGIGVGRLAASVCEAHHDVNGPIWPMSIAPWQVHLCSVRAEDAGVREYADSLYTALEKSGTEVLYDDRSVTAGVMFSDADLLGVPVRVVVSPRNLKENCCEITSRDKNISIKAPLETACAVINELVRQLLQPFSVDNAPAHTAL